jgi:hypothetical protein
MRHMNYKRLSIAGHLSMTQAEAKDLIDSGHKVMLHIWGEGPYVAKLAATPLGLAYRKSLLALGSAPDDPEPEVSARLVAGATRSLESRRRVRRVAVPFA